MSLLSAPTHVVIEQLFSKKFQLFREDVKAIIVKTERSEEYEKIIKVSQSWRSCLKGFACVKRLKDEKT